MTSIFWMMWLFLFYFILNMMQLGTFIHVFKKSLIHKSMIILSIIYYLKLNLFTNLQVFLQKPSLRIGWYFGVKELVIILNKDKWQYLTKLLFNCKKRTCKFISMWDFWECLWVMTQTTSSFTYKQYIVLNEACDLNIWFEMLMYTC